MSLNGLISRYWPVHAARVMAVLVTLLTVQGWACNAAMAGKLAKVGLSAAGERTPLAAFYPCDEGIEKARKGGPRRRARGGVFTCLVSSALFFYHRARLAGDREES